jgi:hypothetical protein
MTMGPGQSDQGWLEDALGVSLGIVESVGWVRWECGARSLRVRAWRAMRRRMRDLNPRGVAPYTLSKRAHSATMRILRRAGYLVRTSRGWPTGEGGRQFGPGDSGGGVSASAITLGGRPLARRPSHEPPQGRKAARVSGPWRVRGGSFLGGWLQMHLRGVSA